MVYGKSTTSSTRLINDLIILFVSLGSIKFYTLFMSQTIGKGIVLLDVLVVMAFLVLFIIYGDNNGIRSSFNTEVVLIFLALIISAFSAKLFHNQPIFRTLYAQHELYVFLFYFLLHKIRPEPGKLTQMFIWLGYIYAALYIIQFLVYPIQLVTAEPHIERGTIRVAIPGADYMILSWFIILSKFFQTKRIRNIFALIPFLIVMIMLASRQVLASIALATLAYILFSKAVKSRIVMFALIALAIIPFYFLFQGVFDQLIAVSGKAEAGILNNIRIMAAKYFLFDLNHNPLWIFIGNGMPEGHSDYGSYLLRISTELGYYQSDIGIIGDFSKFGILMVIAELSFLVRLTKYKTSEKLSFIRYYALIAIITLFTGAGLGISTIIVFCFLFYLSDLEKHFDEKKIR